ncbi:MAG TPA: AprI/Inh family metalloprotease inhibitor [Devosia sp.]|nr:AprI/Inh family metalloprotease inhibitor [Devosia sp.]
MAQGTLPAIGATGTPAPGLSGQPVLGGVAAQPAPGFGTLPPVQGSTIQSATYNGTLAPLTQPGAVSAGPEGVWTVLAGTNQCRLNLPLTLKDGANYYRASAPGCAMPVLSNVAGWQQVGQQLQLYDVNGNIAGSLVPSGGRYIGTLAGGVGITMQR